MCVCFGHSDSCVRSFTIKAVSTVENSSDLGTKALTSERIRQLLSYVGMFNVDGVIQPLKNIQKVSNVRKVAQSPSNAMVRGFALLSLAVLSRAEDGEAEGNNSDSMLVEISARLERI